MSLFKGRLCGLSCPQSRFSKILTGLTILGLILWPSAADAGSGRFAGGQFDIFVTLSTNATATEIQNIQDRFTQASQLLFDATDGQARFGTVTIFNNNTALEFADALINMTSTGTANASGTNLGLFGNSLDLFYDDDVIGIPQDDAWQTIAHEFAHYAFKVKDEYSGPGGGAECVTPTPATACLMDNYKAVAYNDASEFCWSGNHDPDGDTFQTSSNGESCWATIHDGYPTLGGPLGAPTEAAPGGFVAPAYQVFTNPVLRVVFVLDNSGSMNGPGGVSPGVTRIQDLNTFAQQFIDLMGTNDVQLGIVSYNSTTTDAFPVTLLNNAMTVNNAKDAVPDTAGGSTNIGGGLARGRDLATTGPAPGPLIIVLMTDGFHNFPPGDPSAEPLAVLPSVVSAGIHVHTVALGDSTNETLLRQIAKDSGGIFWKANNSVEFEPIFTSLAAVIRGGSILDSPQRHLLAPGEAHVSSTPSTQPGLSGEISREGNVQPVLHSVFVEDGSREAAFNLGWSAANAQLELYLLSPSGQQIGPDEVRAGKLPKVRLHEGERYRSYVIQSPERGLWQLGVLATANPSGTTYVLQPTAINPQVHAFADARKIVPAPGAPPVIHLTAVARDRIPITNLSVQATMTDPSGGTSFVQLWDDGSPAHRDEIAGDGTYSAAVTAASNGIYHFEITLRAAAGAATVIPGEEPPPTVDNRTLYSVRDFWRSFAVDVTVNEIPGNPPGDSDGDRIPDSVEGGQDPDGDSIPNNLDHDSDGDDLSDLDEGTGDPDGDGIPSFLDTDSDGDGLPDNQDPQPNDPQGGGGLPSGGLDNRRLEIGYFLGGYLFDEDFPVDREILYGFRFGVGLTDRIDLESEITLASAHDAADRHGFITNANLLAALNFGGGKVHPFASLGVGWFDFSEFSPGVDTSGLAPILGAGWKYHVRPQLAGRLELRYLNFSSLDVEEDHHFEILWGMDIAF